MELQSSLELNLENEAPFSSGAAIACSFHRGDSRSSDLESLSDGKLVADLKSLVARERELVTTVLRYLLEVENRRLFLARGYSSMFAFCTEHLGYSHAEAHVRISAMRLMRAVPQVEKEIECGNLGLFNAAQAASVIREESKKEAMTTEQKEKIVEMVLGKSTREAESVLAENFPTSKLKRDVTKQVGPDEVEFRFCGPKRLQDKLNRLKELRAHTNFAGKLDRLIEDLADLALEKWEPKPPKASKSATSEQAPRKETESKRKFLKSSGSKDKPQPNDTSFLRAPEVLEAEVQSIVDQSGVPTDSREAGEDRKDKTQRSRSIPQETRRQVYARAEGRCEFTDTTTGKRCTSKHGLQFDHIHEFAKGGTHEGDNLRLYCGPHNRARNFKTS